MMTDGNFLRQSHSIINFIVPVKCLNWQNVYIHKHLILKLIKLCWSY